MKFLLGILLTLNALSAQAAKYIEKGGTLDSLVVWEDDKILMATINGHFRCAIPLKKDGQPINEAAQKVLLLAFSLQKQVTLSCDEEDKRTHGDLDYWTFHRIIVHN